MKSVALALGALASCAMLEAPAAAHPLFSKCPPDSARVGTTCIDKYEASGQQSLGLGGPLPGTRWWLVTADACSRRLPRAVRTARPAYPLTLADIRSERGISNGSIEGASRRTFLLRRRAMLR